MPASVMFAKAPQELKKPRGAPEWRARVRKDAGSALKARTKKRLTRLLGAPPPLGKRKKRNGRRPGAQLNRDAERLRGLFDIVKKVRTSA